MFLEPSALGLPAIVAALFGWAPCSFAQDHAGSQMPAVPGAVVARADIRACGDARSSVGLAYLRERPSTEGVKEVDIMVRVWSGLLPGKHAVHIHETANCQPCSAAGGHFDPGPHSNSNPDGNHPFHSGDLVNLNISGRGRGLLGAVSSRVSLSEGPLSLFDEDGSAFIIHHQPDSYCPEGVVSGCAGGSRAACGVIVRDN
ncbi:MAG: superoxide dismutase family protein [Bryobacterales bacterium]|nr:superoxide dismutase family protein [Bryobacterales bacterium]